MARWTEADVRAAQARVRGDVVAKPVKAPVTFYEHQGIPTGRAIFRLPMPPSKNERHGYNVVTGEKFNRIGVNEFFKWCRLGLQEQKRQSIFEGQYPLTCRLHADIVLFVPPSWGGDTHNRIELLMDGLEQGQVIENDRQVRTLTLREAVIAEDAAPYVTVAIERK